VVGPGLGQTGLGLYGYDGLWEVVMVTAWYVLYVLEQVSSLSLATTFGEAGLVERLEDNGLLGRGEYSPHPSDNGDFCAQD